MSVSIRTIDLSARRGGTVVLSEISIALHKSRWTGVIGANGSGKTTLLKVLAGRLAHDGGVVMLPGSESSASRIDRALRVGFAPEAALLPSSLTGAELLAMMAEERPADTQPLCTLREALEINRLERLRISAMSAGMKQRIALYSAFVSRSDLVILDEPFNWLDPVCTFDVKEALRQLVDREGLTLVTALHDLGTLTTYCDFGVLLTGGRVVRMIPADELRTGADNLPLFESRLIQDLRTTRCSNEMIG